MYFDDANSEAIKDIFRAAVFQPYSPSSKTPLCVQREKGTMLDGKYHLLCILLLTLLPALVGCGSRDNAETKPDAPAAETLA